MWLFLSQIHVMWTVCGRGWSRSFRVPCGPSGNPLTNSSSTFSFLGLSMKWLRNRPERQRVLRPAALDMYYKMESVVSLEFNCWAVTCCCSTITRSTGGFRLFSSLVSCSVGTFYSGEQEQCVQCPLGTYQDTVGQLSCEPCPSTEVQGVAGAKNVSQCGGN